MQGVVSDITSSEPTRRSPRSSITYKGVLKQRGELVYDEPPIYHVPGRPLPRRDDGIPARGLR